MGYSDTLVDTSSICPNVEEGSIFKYECMQCGLDITDACSCVWDTDTEYINVWCYDCEDQHRDIWIDELIEHLYYSDDDDYYWDPARSNDEDGDDTPIGEATYRFIHRCRHYNVPIEFSDGTTIYASSEHSREPGDAVPDFGLYLDHLWQPECLAYFIEWPDMGLPKYRDAAAKAIIDTYNKARNGLWVEVGCIGGHGRTGTVLACMAILSGKSVQDAIKLVKNDYCSSAIETDRQEWFVEWFYAFIHGGATTPEPYYDRDAQKWAEGPVVEFDGPYHWKEFDIFDDPQGSPPEEQCKTALDEYALKSWDTVSAGKKTVSVYPDEEDWDEAVDWMLAKYKEMYPDDDETKTIEDIEDIEEVEAYAEEVEEVDGPIWAKEVF